MKATTGQPGDNSVMLLPHQTNFVETALSPTSGRVVILRGGVGLGKTGAMVALASRVIRRKATARVLVLCPRALVRDQWVASLHEEETPVLPVDRYKFRELLQASSSNDVWPRGCVVVLTDDFANKPDITESLAGVQWDIVIADEAHRFKGTRAELLRRLRAAAERLVLATANHEGPDALTTEGATVVDWQYDQLLDSAGRPLVTGLKPLLREVAFSITPSELRLSQTAHALVTALEEDTPRSKFVARSLLRSLRSSPAAFESSLRRLALRLEDKDEISLLQEEVADVEEEDEETTPELIAQSAAEHARAILAGALQELEDIHNDSKVGAFSALLGGLAGHQKLTQRICVVTDYLATLYYLAAEVEERGLNYSLFHGGMTYKERHESLAKFSTSGGILLATRGLLREGLSLSGVTDVVLYDLPDNDELLSQVLGRFDRVGRTSQLVVHALARSDGADSNLIGQLRRQLDIGDDR